MKETHSLSSTHEHTYTSVCLVGCSHKVSAVPLKRLRTSGQAIIRSITSTHTHTHAQITSSNVKCNKISWKNLSHLLTILTNEHGSHTKKYQNNNGFTLRILFVVYFSLVVRFCYIDLENLFCKHDFIVIRKIPNCYWFRVSVVVVKIKFECGVFIF